MQAQQVRIHELANHPTCEQQLILGVQRLELPNQLAVHVLEAVALRNKRTREQPHSSHGPSALKF
jgi:hypothetical protein